MEEFEKTAGGIIPERPAASRHRGIDHRRKQLVHREGDRDRDRSLWNWKAPLKVEVDNTAEHEDAREDAEERPTPASTKSE